MAKVTRGRTTTDLTASGMEPQWGVKQGEQWKKGKYGAAGGMAIASARADVLLWDYAPHATFYSTGRMRWVEWQHERELFIAVSQLISEMVEPSSDWA